MQFQWIHAHDSLSVLKENPQLDISGEASKKMKENSQLKHTTNRK
jgi:hypothetical protein